MDSYFIECITIQIPYGKVHHTKEEQAEKAILRLKGAKEVWFNHCCGVVFAPTSYKDAQAIKELNLFREKVKKIIARYSKEV